MLQANVDLNLDQEFTEMWEQYLTDEVERLRQSEAQLAQMIAKAKLGEIPETAVVDALIVLNRNVQCLNEDLRNHASQTGHQVAAA